MQVDGQLLRPASHARSWLGMELVLSWLVSRDSSVPAKEQDLCPVTMRTFGGDVTYRLCSHRTLQPYLCLSCRKALASARNSLRSRALVSTSGFSFLTATGTCKSAPFQP